MWQFYGSCRTEGPTDPQSLGLRVLRTTRSRSVGLTWVWRSGPLFLDKMVLSYLNRRSVIYIALWKARWKMLWSTSQLRGLMDKACALRSRHYGFESLHWQNNFCFIFQDLDKGPIFLVLWVCRTQETDPKNQGLRNFSKLRGPSELAWTFSPKDCRSGWTLMP